MVLHWIYTVARSGVKYTQALRLMNQNDTERRWAYGVKGTVGLIKPTYRPGSLEETIRYLPEGVGVIPMHAGVRQGSTSEFKEILKPVVERIEELAALEVDAIYVEGAPPSMILGYQKSEDLSFELTKKYGIPVAFAPQALTNALKFLGISNLIGITYTPDDQNQVFTKYLSDAGFNVLAMDGIQSAFEHADRITPEQVYEFAINVFSSYKKCEGIYLFGGAWRVMPAILRLEKDLGIPVVGGIQASIWYIMRLLGCSVRVPNAGRLLN